MIGRSTFSDRRLRVGGLLTLSAACAVTVGLGWESPVRSVLAIAFLLFVPGLAVTELLDVRDLALRLTIATAMSLALDTVVSMVLLYAHAWSIGRALAILIALSVAALAGAAALSRPRDAAHLS